MAKAQTNPLQLEEYFGRGKRHYDKTCKLCHQEEENLEHFLVKCPLLQCKRNKEVMDPWKNLSTKKQTAYILFKDKNYERTGDIVKKCGSQKRPSEATLKGALTYCQPPGGFGGTN